MNPDFEKTSGLIPAIVQHAESRQVLMLGYMNREALDATNASGKVTFYSRTKKRLWTKGETSGNCLNLVSMAIDCDRDTLLVKAIPTGPVCHTGTPTCFGDQENEGFLGILDGMIAQRYSTPSETSYTSSLFAAGIGRMAQKVGEEATEVVIEALGRDDALLLNESADLLFHLMVLLRARGYSIADVEKVLESRNQKSP